MKQRRHGRAGGVLAVLLAAAMLMTGCGTGKQTSAGLTGAGATFPYPLYSRMFDAYNAATGVRVNYNSIGSGGGIKALTDKTVDFGASDAYLTSQELSQVGAPVLHIPTCAGAVVLSYNLDGKPSLRLDGPTIAQIFLGTITKWNDPRIAALNSGVKLPDLAISVVHRSDGSGTTSIFTSYLSAVSNIWKQKVGAGKSVSWPVGLGGKGNDGVAGMIGQTRGAVGYIELVYAAQTGMPTIAVRNAAGAFIVPSLQSVTAAAAEVTMPDDLRVLLINASGKGAYPISALTWILVYREQRYDGRPLQQAQALQDLLVWMLHDGQKINEGLSYAPLPAAVVQKAMKLVESMTYGGSVIPQ